MSDNLEQYIKKNRKKFDTQSPSKDVWENIEKNISPVFAKEKRTKIIRFNAKFFLSRAAAVIAIFLASYYVHQWRNPIITEGNKTIAENKTMHQSEIAKELLEAEAYYNAEVNKTMNKIMILTNNDADVQKFVQSNLQEMDSVYIELKKDLKDDFANQEVIEAMIQNYRLKLMVLEDILEKLKSYGNENTNKQKQKQYDV